MKPEPVSHARFQKSLSALQRRAEEAARDCIDRPTPDAIHEARIAIRKLKAGVSLAPREFRRDKKTVKSLKALDALYADCAKIRDIDTMAETLSAAWAAEATKDVVAHLKRRRSLLLDRVMGSAIETRKLQFPKSESLQRARLRKRLRRLLDERTARAVRLYTVAASGEQYVEELHALRKECRRIMYLMDFVKGSARVKPIRDELEDARQRLGLIREDDVLLDLIKGFRGGPRGVIVDRVASGRQAKYRDFFSKQGLADPKLLKGIRSLA